MSSQYYPPPPSRGQGQDRSSHARPGHGLQHTASAPHVPPNAMGQHPAPQHPPPPHMLQSPQHPPSPHMLQSRPPPIDTGVSRRIPPGLNHPATAPTQQRAQSPYVPPQGPHQHHQDSFGPPFRTSSAAQMYTPPEAQTRNPPHVARADNAHVPSPTSRYPPMPPPPPPPTAVGHHTFASPSTQHPFSSPPTQYPYSPPASAHGQPQAYNPNAPESHPQSQPQSPESAEPRIPTLAELEARLGGSHSRPNSNRSQHSRPHSRDGRRPASKDPGWVHHILPSAPKPSSKPQQSHRDKSSDEKPAWKTKAGAALGSETVLDSVELGFEGLVKAAGSL